MENYLIVAIATVIVFFAGFQCHASMFRYRRRRQRGY